MRNKFILHSKLIKLKILMDHVRHFSLRNTSAVITIDL